MAPLLRAVRSVSQKCVPGAFEVVFRPTMVTVQDVGWHPWNLGNQVFSDFLRPVVIPPLHSLCSPSAAHFPMICGRFWWGRCYFLSFGCENGRAGEAGAAEGILSPIRTKPKGERIPSANRSWNPIFQSKRSLARLEASWGKVHFSIFQIFAGSHAFFVFRANRREYIICTSFADTADGTLSYPNLPNTCSKRPGTQFKAPNGSFQVRPRRGFLWVPAATICASVCHSRTPSNTLPGPAYGPIC